MTLVVAGVMWSGYLLAWWGRETLRGCQVGFGDLAIPGRYRGCNTEPGDKTNARPGTTPTTTTGTTTPPAQSGPVNTPPTVPPGWVNPFGNPANDVKR